MERLTVTGAKFHIPPKASKEDLREEIKLHQKYYDKLTQYEDAEEQGLILRLPSSGIGDLSDGYHTFNELYHHRALLFATICNLNPDKAWKSMKHHDGTMYDGMFIVGIETTLGRQHIITISSLTGIASQ